MKPVWIGDRLPTKEDADSDGYVVVPCYPELRLVGKSKEMHLRIPLNWLLIAPGQLWAHSDEAWERLQSKKSNPLTTLTTQQLHQRATELQDQLTEIHSEMLRRLQK
jgi:hypothetical protein